MKDYAIIALIFVLTSVIISSMVILGGMGVGIRTLIEVTRYMSPVGKFLSLLLMLGMFVFLTKAIILKTTRDK